jgi:two-component sensor histidine kinase
MLSSPRGITGMLTWGSTAGPIARWTVASGLFVIAFGLRLLLGSAYGANPALTFYPAILLGAVLIGWKEATWILFLSVASGTYMFVSPEMYLRPLAWAVVGGLTIAIVYRLKTLAEELAVANDRQRLLFQELQHRVANTLQGVAGGLALAERRITTSPAEASQMLKELSHRVAASSEVHRRLTDPALFEARTLESILEDAVVTVVDAKNVHLDIEADDVPLTFDQFSILTMLAIEIANNAQKHVFAAGRGTMLCICIRKVAEERAMLIARDDGPGLPSEAGTVVSDSRIGLELMRSLAQQLRGVLSITSSAGTAIVVEFPIRGSA